MINTYNRWFYQLLSGVMIFGTVFLMVSSFMGSVVQMRDLDGKLGILDMPTSSTLQAHLDDAVEEFITFGTLKVNAQLAVAVVENIGQRILETAIMAIVSNFVLDLIDKAFGAILDFIDIAISFVTSAIKNVFNVFSAVARKSLLDYDLFGVSVPLLLETISTVYTTEITEDTDTVTAETITKAASEIVKIDKVKRACAVEDAAQARNSSSTEDATVGCDPNTLSALDDSAEEIVTNVESLNCEELTETTIAREELPTVFSGCDLESQSVGQQAVSALNVNKENQLKQTEAALDEASALSKAGECPGAYVTDSQGDFSIPGANDLPTIAFGETRNNWWSVDVNAQSLVGLSPAAVVESGLREFNSSVQKAELSYTGVPPEVCAAAQDTNTVLAQEASTQNPCGFASGCEGFVATVLGAIINNIVTVIDALKDAVLDILNSFTSFLSVFAFSAFNFTGVSEAIINETQNITSELNQLQS